jgi:hypothetical protein
MARKKMPLQQSTNQLSDNFLNRLNKLKTANKGMYPEANLIGFTRLKNAQKKDLVLSDMIRMGIPHSFE